MKEAAFIIESFVKQSQEILSSNLAGIYLHGSAVMGCFNPAKSDLDFIVVTDRGMNDDAKRTYMDMMTALNAEGPAKGIEMSIVKRGACKPFIYPTPFELHFSARHITWYTENPADYIQKMNGTDKDLAAHFTIIRARGKCLYGAPVNDVFDEVPVADYMDSIREDICDAEEDIADNTMYLTLNLARVLAFKKEGLILSKKEGGEWGLKNLPLEFAGVIQTALEEYAADFTAAAKTVPARYNPALVQKYAKYMLGEINVP